MAPKPAPKRRKRWLVALGAAIGALTTTMTESVIIGQTVADLFVKVVASLG